MAVAIVAAAPKILFVDDDEASIRSLISSLRRLGTEFEFLSTGSTQEAITTAKKEQPEVAVIDLSIEPSRGPESGYELLDELQTLDPTIRVLVLTGHGANDYGLEALQRGAASFLVKPADPKHLNALIRDAVSFSCLQRSYQQLSTKEDNLKNFTGLSSKSSSMDTVIEGVAYAASNNQPVLLVGETGVGKGVIAEAIHRASSRKSGPFLRFQAGFGSSDLVSSELFGHQKGAFTGAVENRTGLLEEANQGTLFIDEVDEIPGETQVLLLNVLQEKVFKRLGSNKEIRSDFRLIAATNQNLEKILKTGKLRADLYHRIAHFTIEIPSLAERKADIPDLVNLFVANLSNKEKLAINGLTQAALAKLTRHNWPGNVRELQAVVEGGVYRASYARRRFVLPEDLRIQARGKTGKTSELSFREKVSSYEIQIIEEALAKANNNQSLAAELLQLDRSTLRRILARKEG